MLTIKIIMWTRAVCCAHNYNPLSGGDLYFSAYWKVPRSRFTFTSFWNLLFNRASPSFSGMRRAPFPLHIPALTFSLLLSTEQGKRVVKRDVGRDLVWGKGYLGVGFRCFCPLTKSAPFDPEKNRSSPPLFLWYLYKKHFPYLSALTRDAKKDKRFSHAPIKFQGHLFGCRTAAEVWIPSLSLSIYKIMCSSSVSMRCESVYCRRPRTSLSDCQQGITWSEITKLAVSVLWVSFKIMMHLSDEDDDGLLGTS